jgi:endonuclease/exonuclease/phosphatase family metal-dependent hydrolase
MGAETDDFTCISWNVHRARGNDGVIDPARTLRVLQAEVWQEGAAALILTEADEEVPPHRGLLDIAGVEAATGLRCVHRDAGQRWGGESHGFLGVIVFLHPAFAVQEVTMLDLPGHCHRGAVVVDAQGPGGPVRLIGTHLSLGQPLRVAQMRTLGQHLFRRVPRPVILAGDLNEWRPWGGLALSPRVLGMRLAGPAPPTFPIRRPFLPLDRVLAGAGAQVAAVRVGDGPGIRLTSDHRPILGRVRLARGD